MFKYQKPTVEAVGVEDLEEEEAMEEVEEVEEEEEEAGTAEVVVAEEVEEEVVAVVVVELRFTAFTSLNLPSTSHRHQFMFLQHQSM